MTQENKLNYFFLNTRSCFFWGFLFLYMYMFIYIHINYTCIDATNLYSFQPPSISACHQSTKLGTTRGTFPSDLHPAPPWTSCDGRRQNHPVCPQSVTFAHGQLVDGGSWANSTCAGINFFNFQAAFVTICCFFFLFGFWFLVLGLVGLFFFYSFHLFLS